MGNLTLYCWLNGQGVETVFSVQISSSKKVSDLKVHLADYVSRLWHTSAADLLLDLYAIPYPDENTGIKDILNQWAESNTNLSLSPLDQLSMHFSRTQKWLIIIDPPIANINCWVRGRTTTEIVQIQASRRRNVLELRDLIKARIPGLNTAAEQLMLYKVSLPGDILGETLKGLRFDPRDQLNPLFPLCRYFPHPPPPTHLHIVIEELPSRKYGKRAREEAEDDFEQVRRSKMATMAPSALGVLGEYREMQEDPMERLRDDRAIQSGEMPMEPYNPDVDVPPISLLYEGFGDFLDIVGGRKDVSGIDKVQPMELRSAVDAFAEQMTLCFAEEMYRRDRGRPSLDNIFSARTDNAGPSQITEASIGSVRTDGHVIGPHGAAYCIVEFKNESCDVSTIPYVEMASYFAHSIKKSFDPVVRRWRVPCLGITVVGPCVTFYAVIFIRQYRVVRLTPTLSCMLSASGGRDREALYSAFTAASVLVARIKADAQRLSAHPPPQIDINRLVLPFISSIHDHLFNTHIQFEILDFHPNRHPGRLVYLAQTTDNKDIVIKFTQSYSVDLHVLCASLGHAPKLLGFERLPGGHFAIAMECMASAHWQPLSKSKHFGKHVTKLRDLVGEFHRKGFVHGDLRSPNIICDEDRVMLIDFDWSGKLGEASYPPVRLNPHLTEGRHSADLTITLEDDLRVLERTLSKIPSPP